jgi:hypothetical protein
MTLECTRFYQNLKCSVAVLVSAGAPRITGFRQILAAQAKQNPRQFPTGGFLRMSFDDLYYQLR